ncbi:MAG: YjjG family noncanonical pyrimidine nucleotidase [Clostridia bacterium]|nr:YjjG family noncanonical pyrimidine nucleotidase [Clostridia bacterium]
MKYTTVYLDLDNTLLDFSAAEASAVGRLLRLYGVEAKPEYICLYSEINRKYWELFECGKIEREEIFEGRFIEFTRAICAAADTEKMSKDYFSLLAEGHEVLPGAIEVLQYLQAKKYTLCATTNGVSVTQEKRIRESGLGEFFDFVFISEKTGYQKPQKEYFDYVMAHTPEKDKSKIIVVGDSVTSDISGGINFGIDTCWLNAKAKQSPVAPTYEISDIKELIGIL